MPPENELAQAIALHRQGRKDAAEQHYRAVLAADPLCGEASHNLAILLLEQGAAEECLARFDAALKADPSQAHYWLSYAKALLRLARPDAARALLLEGKSHGLAGPLADALLDAAGGAPETPQSLLERGSQLLAQGEIEGAIAACRKALALDPDFAEAHFRLGSLLSEHGRIAEGFAHYMRRAQLLHGDGGPPCAQEPEHKTKHDREQKDYLAAMLPDGPAPAFRLEDGARLPGPAVNPAPQDLIARWSGAAPQAVVIDGFLAPGAMEKLRLYCAGSTIWRRVYAAGYIGATPEDGFASPLLAQIAEEISQTYAAILRGHAFRYLGAFKYDSTLSQGTNTHADNSAVNVNLYIAPDEANLDPDTGGMDIWDVAMPADIDMRVYNGDEAAAQAFLARTGARKTVIPHRANRAVIFRSDLFHKTSDCRFQEGYLNKRINISLLFGDRGGV